MINGGLGGMLSWVYSYPVDVIKTHKQIYNLSYINIINNIKIKKYTRGMSTVLLRSFIVNAGIFYVYEKIKEDWSTWKSREPTWLDTTVYY